jgi:hypothetical protein
MGKPEGNRPLDRPMRRWEDNIKAVLQEVVCGGMDWIELAQDSGVPSYFVRGSGGSTNSVEDRGQSERGSGDGSPSQGLHSLCKLVKPVLLLACYRWNWECGWTLSKLRNFEGSLKPPTPHHRYATGLG